MPARGVTPLLTDPLEDGRSAAVVVAASGAVITPEAVAQSVIEGLAEGRFLILPHPEVGGYWSQKAADPDRWLRGVRRLMHRITQP